MQREPFALPVYTCTKPCSVLSFSMAFIPAYLHAQYPACDFFNFGTKRHTNITKEKKMTLFIDFEIVFNLLYVDLPYLCGSDGLVVVVRFKNLELVQVFLDLLVGSALSVRAEDLSHTLVCDNHIVIPVVTIVQHMYYWQDFFIHFQTTTLSFHRSKNQIIWQIIDLLIKGYSFLCIYTSTVH